MDESLATLLFEGPKCAHGIGAAVASASAASVSAAAVASLRGSIAGFLEIIKARISSQMLHDLDRAVGGGSHVGLDHGDGGGVGDACQDDDYHRPCGHVFQLGEGVYCCRDCALDQTCVLCYRCFHATNHDGHDTQFTITQKSGGCCDCGDKEAWRTDMRCAYHSPLPEQRRSAERADSYPLDDTAVSSMRETIATILDYVIDTLSACPVDLTIPPSADAIRRANPPETESERLAVMTPAERELRELAGSSVSPDNDSAEAVYTTGGVVPLACIVWNDEMHSYDEFIDRFVTAAKLSRSEAKLVTETIDIVGRDVVFISTSVPHIASVARRISVAGISVSIRSVRETFREIIAGHLVAYLRDLVRKSSHALNGTSIVGGRPDSVSATIRRILCEELANDRRFVRETAMGYDSDVESFTDRATGQRLRRRRIDCLLGLDSRLWKSLRSALREIYIGTMIIGGDEFKRLLGIRFASNHLLTASSYLIHDREWDISIVHFSVQLFTVPTIASHLVANSKILETIFSMLKALFLSEVYPLHMPLNRFIDSFILAFTSSLPHYPKLNCESPLIYEKPRYMHLFYDIRYLLSTPTVASDIFRNQCRPAFIKFLDLCRVVQGMNPQKRELRDHVLFESKGWINCFNLSLNVGRAVEFVGESFAPATHARVVADFEALKAAIRHTTRVLDQWCAHEQVSERAFLEDFIAALIASGGAGANLVRPRLSVDGFRSAEYMYGLRFRVVEYRVLMRPISLHHPLHWMLSMLLSMVPYYLLEMREQKIEIEPNDLLLESLFFPGDTVVNEEFDESLTVDESLALPDPPKGEQSSLAGTSLPRPKEIPTEVRALVRSDRISRIMDHALRVEVMLSQIRAGLWVRNGQIMRDQAMYFRHLSLRDLRDHGIFLIQSCCVVLGGDRFITTVLERFELSAWFSGRLVDAVRQSHIELQALDVLAEELLSLLVMVITERSRAAGLSFESQVRRELIHLLALHPSGQPHSKLVESIPERLVRIPSSVNVDEADVPKATRFGPRPPRRGIDNILPTIATFRLPDGGASDVGMYVLRDEFYDEVDPYFWHYTPGQRAEVEAVLHARRSKKKARKRDGLDILARGGVDTEHARRILDLQLPRIEALADECGFNGLDRVVSGRIFTQMIFFGLYNITRSASSGPSAPSSSSGPQNVPLTSTVNDGGDISLSSGDTQILPLPVPVPSTLPPVPVIVSDRLLAVIVHLMLVAVAIETNLNSLQEVRSDGTNTSNNRFLDNIGSIQIEVGFGNTASNPTSQSLLDMVFRILSRSSEDEFSEYIDRLAFVVVAVEEFGGVAARIRIAKWREELQRTKEGDNGSGGDGDGTAMDDIDDDDGDDEGPRKRLKEKAASASGERRAAAKRRQMAIMAQMAEQQRSFMENYRHDEDFLNEAMDVDINDGPGESSSSVESKNAAYKDSTAGSSSVAASLERLWHFPRGNCIVCQEELIPNSGMQYGMLALMQATHIRRSRMLDFSDPASVLKAASVGRTLDCEFDRLSGFAGGRAENPPSPSQQTTTPPAITTPLSLPKTDGEVFASSCGHLMHFACYDIYRSSTERRQLTQEYRSHPEDLERYEFLCPLCKTLGNCILPIVSESITESVIGPSISSKSDESIVDSFAVSPPSFADWAEDLTSWWTQIGLSAVTGLITSADAGKAAASSVNSYAWLHALVDAGMHRPLPDLPFLGDDGDMTPAAPPPSAATEADGSTFSRLISALTTDLLNRSRSRAAADRDSIHVSASSNMRMNNGAFIGRKDDDVRAVIMRLVPTLVSLRDSVYSSPVTAPVNDFRDSTVRGKRADVLSMLSAAMASTISGLERVQRGAAIKAVASSSSSRNNGVSLSSGFVGVLEGVSKSSLTMLRILADSTLTIGTVVGDGRIRSGVVISLFGGALPELSSTPSNSHAEPSVLVRDPFQLLVDVCMLNGSSSRLVGAGSFHDSIRPLISLMWTAEVVRILVVTLESALVFKDGWASELKKFYGFMPLDSRGTSMSMNGYVEEPFLDSGGDVVMESAQSESEPEFFEFVKWILSTMSSTLSDSEVSSRLDASSVLKLVCSLTLPFLRKCVLFVYCRFGMTPSVGSYGFGFELSEPTVCDSLSEDERLRSILGLPSVESICSKNLLRNEYLLNLVSHWVRTLAPTLAFSMSAPSMSVVEEARDNQLRRLVMLDTPAIFELIPLPTQLELLFEGSYQFVCENCRKVIAEPALCLICGTLVCAMSFCCTKNGIGECNQHMRNCGGDIGIFFLVKKFRILLLNHEKGAFMDPPYLDSYGETDLNLRKGRLQYLTKRRYDDIRRIWLTHGVPGQVARGIDGKGAFGRWNTF